MIEPMDYATVVSDKKLKNSGLRRGDVVLVMGTKLVPATKKDPYLQRTLVTVLKVMYGLPLFPKDDNDHMAYLIDPRSLEKVSDEEAEQFREKLTQQYQ